MDASSVLVKVFCLLNIIAGALSQGYPPQGAIPGQAGGFGGWPQQGQGGFPPQQGQGGFPPQQGQGGFPPQQGQGGFPGQGGFLPQQGQGQGGFPPQQGQGGFPGFPQGTQNPAMQQGMDHMMHQHEMGMMGNPALQQHGLQQGGFGQQGLQPGLQQGMGQNIPGLQPGMGQNIPGLQPGMGQNIPGQQPGMGQNIPGLQNGMGQNIPGLQPGMGQHQPGFQQGLGNQQDLNGIHQDAINQDTLQLDPLNGQTAAVPDGSHPGTEVYRGGDASVYAVDWSYPRTRFAPNNLILKKFGSHPPEYVAVYRFRGPANRTPLEMHRPPWDYPRAPGGRYPPWRYPPNSEEFELMPYNSRPGGDYYYGHI